MKFLVLSLLLAVAAAAPLASPDSDDDNVKKVHHYVATPAVYHQKTSPAVGFTQVVHPHTTVLKHGASHVVSGATGIVGTVGVAPAAVAYGAVSDDDDDDVDHKKSVVFSHNAPVVHHAVGHQQLGAVTFQNQYAVPGVATVHHSAPTVTSYNAAHVVGAAVPSVATHHVAGQVVGAAPAVSAHTYSAAPAVATHAVAAAPAVVSHAVAAAPAVHVAHATPVKYEAKVEVSEPVVTVHQQAIPSTYTYETEQVVNLGNKEIDVPVQSTHVHVPIEKKVHYGVEKYVAGSTTTIHKPKLSAPAIDVPKVFKPKTVHAAPEVTLKHSEVTVQEKSPNYVHAKYDAGVVVEEAPGAVQTYDVPTPVDVPHPVPVAQPYAVPVAQPVKVKSQVKPVVNVDVHQFETQNVVKPIEYTAHHVATPTVHAAVAPAVQAAVVAPAVHTGVVAAPAVQTGIVGNAVHATQYHAVASPAAVATHGQVVTGHVAHGHVASSPAVVAHGHVAAAPVATAYGVTGGVTGHHGFVTGQAVHGVAGYKVGSGENTVAYGAHVPVQTHFVAGHQPVKVETSDNFKFGANFVQVPSVAYTGAVQGQVVHHGTYHKAAAPVAVVPDN